MAVAVPSRFACLKIEDDDYRPKTNLNKPTVIKTKKNETKNTVVKNKKNTTNNNKPIKSTKPTVKTPKTNGENSTKPQSTGKNGNKKKKESDQWEKWKEKDMLLVDGTYEEDLQNAIMLSKLDYEEKKEFYQQNKKEESNEKSKEINGKKNKKKKAMTLEQFNCMVDPEANPIGDNSTITPSIPKKIELDDKFFEKIHRDAKEALQRERLKQTKKPSEPYNGAVTIAQLQAELDLQGLELDVQRVENATLRKELEAARADIINVKTRNKKLCSLLGQGEMKDKAEVLLEVERLTRVQNELTAEVERLHGLLEQERSKVGALTHEPKHKEKNKKQKNIGNGDTKSQTK